MHSLSCLRVFRILTILLPFAVLTGCGEGQGQQRIQNEPADPFSGPPASCLAALTFEDICDQQFEIVDFEGGVLSLIDNPQIDSNNGSAKVLQMQKFRATSGATFGGSVLDFSAVGSDSINAGDSYTIKVWSQRPVNVLFEPEGGGPGSGDEVAHGGTGWEELTFSPNFTGTTSGFVFIFDNGTLGDAADDPGNWTFYIDDISTPSGGGGGPGPAAAFPITFDKATLPVVTEFGGAGYAIEAGPAGGDGNALKIVRDGGEVFAGAWIAVPEIPNDAGDQTISALVFSPMAGVPMVAKVEFGDNMGSGDVFANEPVVAGWQTLTWTFTNLAAPNVYNRFTILPNLGIVDSGVSYYFDNITLVGAEPPAGCSEAITFEDACPAVEFTDFEGGVSTIVDNPVVNADNPSAKVVRMQKFAAASGFTYGGTVVTFSPPLDGLVVPASSVFTVKVWSQRPVNVLFQPEPAGPGNEVEVAHGGTGWEELTFDLGSFADTVTAWTFIFDNGTLGDAEVNPDNWTFYYDDISKPQTGGGGPGPGDGSFPITFDEATPPVVTEFGGAGYAIEAGPAGGDGNALKIVRDGGDVFAGAWVAVSGIPNDAGTQTLSALVYSPTAGIPMITKLEFDQNMGTGDVPANETVVVGWQTLTWTYTNLQAPNDYTRFVILPNLATVDTAKSYYFDNIDLVDGGGGGATSTDFESGSATFADFEGGVATVIDNPDVSGINTSTKVGQMQKFAGQPFAGSTLDLGGAVPFAAGDSYTMKVRASRSVVVTMKLEPLGEERTATHSGSGSWEELCFDFTAVSGDVTGITLIFDNGTVGDAASDPDNWTFQFDDIEQTSAACPTGGGDATTLPVDFEGDINSYDFGPEGGFEGGAASVVTNPDQSGINTSTQVGQMLKYDGAVFGGATLVIEPTTVTAGSSFTMKVWSQRPVPVLLQPEPQGPGSGIEVAHGGTGWEELTFSLPALSGTVSGITIIFDNGTAGAAATDPTNWTFYFDDITLAPPGDGGGGGDGTVLVTFDETTPPEVNEFGGAIATIEAGPAGGDGNALRILRDGGEVWAGGWFAISGIPNDAGAQTISALVYSPTAGIPMVAKVEYAENMGTGEVSANETVVVGWQTLTWTFTNLAPPNDYNRFVILPNLGTADTATSYYIDNITLVNAGDGGGGGAGTVLVTFDETTPPEVNEFGGAIVTIDAAPAGGDGNALKVLRDGGQVWAGGWFVISGIPNDAGAQTLSALVYSPTAGIPMVAKLEYAENTGTGEVSANETVVEGWQTLTWTFTNLAPPNDYNRFVILPNLGTADTATSYYIDNITLLDAGGGGGGGGAGTALITFDEATPPAVTEFGGAGYAIEAGPAGGDGNALKIVRDGGDVFAGAWVAISGIPNDAGTQTLSALVYSPTAGIPMVTKLEFGQNTGTGDVAANETVVVGWQTLTWTFSNLAAPNDYNRFVILPNLGTVDTAKSYYFDNITLVDAGGGGGGGTGDGSLPVTFDEATPPAVTEFGGAGYAIEAGPAGGDGKALKIVRDGGDVFAGAWVAVSGVPNDAGTQTLSALVYSPTAGIPMVTKLEFAQNTGTGDVSANETVVVGWQTLTWTFTNLAAPNDYSRFVILPNLGTVDTAKSYYFDNITLVGAGGGGGTGDLVVDGGFEVAGTSGLQPPWFVFENGGTVSVSNANDNGGDYSARLQADASSGSSFPILKIERVGAGTVTGGESVTISFDVIDVDTAGAGKTFVAELFTEKADPPGGATNEILLEGYDLTSTWQTRVFDTNLAADAAGGVSLLFKADCGGNTSCTMDVFIDNVSIVIN